MVVFLTIFGLTNLLVNRSVPGPVIYMDLYIKDAVSGMFIVKVQAPVYLWLFISSNDLVLYEFAAVLFCPLVFHIGQCPMDISRTSKGKQLKNNNDILFVGGPQKLWIFEPIILPLLVLYWIIYLPNLESCSKLNFIL